MLKMNRRKFFTGFGSGLLGLSACTFFRKSEIDPLMNDLEDEHNQRILKYNALGNTGLKVSDISFGSSGVFSENVVRYAFDLGVNLFDTAENYQNGKSEEIIGKGLAGIRDKAIIITKYSLHTQPPEKVSDIIDRLERSLKRLKTDYIDILFVYHGINNPAQIKNELIMEAAEKLKKDGKIRFTGFSTHNAIETLNECIKTEYSSFIQVVLFIYNHIDGPKIEHLVGKLNDAKIGTIAMKSQAGGKQGNLKSFVNKKQTYELAALKWVLANKYINSTIISMKTYSHVEAYIKASGKKLNTDDVGILDEYREKVDNIYCRLSCIECEQYCPNNVAISDIMRYAMYYEDYQQEKDAIQYYNQLNNNNKPLNCLNCSGLCDTSCPYKIPVKEKLLQVHELLT